MDDEISKNVMLILCSLQ